MMKVPLCGTYCTSLPFMMKVPLCGTYCTSLPFMMKVPLCGTYCTSLPFMMQSAARIISTVFLQLLLGFRLDTEKAVG